MDIFDRQSFIKHLAIDCVIFGYQNRELKVLVSKLDFKGDFYALPSGFISLNEGVEEAAHRIVQERTGITDIYLEHYKIFGDVNRTNKIIFQQLIEQNREKMQEDKLLKEDIEWFSSRFISLGYYALIDIDKVKLTKSDLDESIQWYNIHHLPKMIIDQNEMVAMALESLKLNLDKNIIILNLLPETFTMKEVQDLYETIFEETYARNNFQKKILDLDVLERLEKKFTGAQNKAPYLYRFRK